MVRPKESDYRSIKITMDSKVRINVVDDYIELYIIQFIVILAKSSIDSLKELVG